MLSIFPLDVLDEMWDVIESVSEGFLTYSYRECLSLEFEKFCVCPSFPFGLEGRMWDLTVLILDHCFSIYFSF